MEPCKLSGGLRNPFAHKEDLDGPGLTGRGITLAQFLSFFLFVPVSVCLSLSLSHTQTYTIFPFVCFSLLSLESCLYVRLASPSLVKALSMAAYKTQGKLNFSPHYTSPAFKKLKDISK